jgi:Fe2+-dicitrate sensor, membrane component
MDKIKSKPVWPKSKEDIWDEVFEHLDEQEHKKFFLNKIPTWGYAACILIPLLLICHFYTVTEDTMKGEHSVVILPDRSTVTMNAESKLSYKPFEWYISKKVKLKGEAFFEVTPGRSFSVQTGQTQVKVLGTTFNVYSRHETCRVTCLSGQVEVHAEKKSIILNPNMQAVFNEKININNNVEVSTATGWMQGKFVFIEMPLQEVIAEVERQYNITVTPDYNPNHLYSGNFSKMEEPEEILEVIGKPFDISFSIE